MSEVLIRAISGVVYIAILLFAGWYSEVSFKILMGIFLILATVEFSRLVRFSFPVGFILAVGLYGAFGFNDLGLQINTFITFFSVFTGLWLVKKLFSPNSLVITNALFKYLIFIGYVVFSFVIMTKIPKVDMEYLPNRIMGVFILIWTNDTFAYLVGKSFGKHKLLERISPKKTVEGFLGGAVLTIIFSVFVFEYFIQGELWIRIIIAVIVVIFSTLGDLIESKFKRSANVKDSGNIMPGHGGILDRLDSIIFTSPFVFLFYQIIDYVS